MSRILSLFFYYAGHLSYLLADRAGVQFMYRYYQWCMLTSIDLDTDHKVWNWVEDRE